MLFCYEMYDELVLLELKEFGGKALVSVENDMQKDSSDSSETVIGKFILSVWWTNKIGFERNLQYLLSYGLLQVVTVFNKHK